MGSRCFIECVTLHTWVRTIFPYLVWHRWTQGRRLDRCYVFDGSWPGMVGARASSWLAGVSVQPLHYRLVDVRDEDGHSVWLRLLHQDVAEVQAEAMEDPMVRRLLARAPANGRLRTYVAKALAARNLDERQTLWRALLTVQVCAWKARGEGQGMRRRQPDDPVVIAFIERRPWLTAIRRYAAQRGVHVVPVPPTVRLRTWVRQALPPSLITRLQGLRSQSLHALQRLKWVLAAHGEGVPRRTRAGTDSAPTARGGGYRMAAQYYGHLNLNHPERYSDLFFWQASSLPASALLVTFGLPQDPLDREKWLELTAHGIDALATHPQATTVPEVPVFLPHHSRENTSWSPDGLGPWSRNPEARWLREHVSAYWRERDYWAELFAMQRVKVYVSWFKNTQTHCAIADALQGLGGVTAIYQRSYEASPSAEAAVAADIVFGFSRAWAEIERQSGSIIPYYITTGYLGDHRFPHLRTRAQAIRDALQQRGARRIVSYCDENSWDDHRRAPGHVITRENYTFLLEQVLTEPWLGLVIKPKVPTTLRRRLGPVARLLERAETTGRCVVLEGGRVHGSYPPAAAALASDLMIHGHLTGATAGAESALAGVPTLLMDREGWTPSPFYRLGVGRVVFTDWPALWKVAREQWDRPGGIPGFGDWSPMLEELDPFRDGRAAQRMGTYLQWLLEGLQAGLDRETVLADSAERYASRWGKDKVVQVNASPRTETTVTSRPDVDVVVAGEAASS